MIYDEAREVFLFFLIWKKYDVSVFDKKAPLLFLLSRENFELLPQAISLKFLRQSSLTIFERT